MLGAQSELVLYLGPFGPGPTQAWCKRLPGVQTNCFFGRPTPNSFSTLEGRNAEGTGRPSSAPG